MSRRLSPSTGSRYGMVQICRVWRMARSTVYAHRAEAPAPGKRGPKTLFSDDELLTQIRTVLDEAERLGIRGEGHRKVWARLRHRGIRSSKRRILRLMRENDLLAPRQLGRNRGPQVHDGTLVTEQPNEMWGTDATTAWTRWEGWAWVFVAIDHCTAECVGVHAAKPGTRYEALEPIHQGVREFIGAVVAGVGTGLAVRHDHGSQYMSDAFQDELAFLGIESSPNFIGAPQGNGIAERFIRTLKEQLLWVEHFDTVEDLRRGLLAFKERYNRGWLVERHDYLTPTQARNEWLINGLVAA